MTESEPLRLSTATPAWRVGPLIFAAKPMDPVLIENVYTALHNHQKATGHQEIRAFGDRQKHPNERPIVVGCLVCGWRAENRLGLWAQIADGKATTRA